MDLRLTFDEDEENYDKWRPKYCPELFEDIIQYSKLNKTDSALEIGCGTGQATEPFLKIGCNITAVEYGSNLAKYISNKYKHYSNLKVENTQFEDFDYTKNSINLVYSATAFHWIPEEIAYTKVFDMLVSGGSIALFWNKPFVNRKNDVLHENIQEIYKRFFYKETDKTENLHLENDTKRYEKITNTIKGYGFVDVECKLYKQTRSFSADDYISLLNTYSDHRTMEISLKIKFEEAIKTAINDSGGILKVYDTMDLYLGRKP